MESGVPFKHNRYKLPMSMADVGPTIAGWAGVPVGLPGVSAVSGVNL